MLDNLEWMEDYADDEDWGFVLFRLFGTNVEAIRGFVLGWSDSLWTGEVPCCPLFESAVSARREALGCPYNPRT
jgi:hypothetical protein